VSCPNSVIADFSILVGEILVFPVYFPGLGLLLLVTGLPAPDTGFPTPAAGFPPAGLLLTAASGFSSES